VPLLTMVLRLQTCCNHGLLQVLPVQIIATTKRHICCFYAGFFVPLLTMVLYAKLAKRSGRLGGRGCM
jgi:hypothetical protein